MPYGDAAPSGGIGNWSPSDLQKFIREYVERTPPTNIPTLVVDDLTVMDSLVAKGSIDFGRGLVNVGGTGAPPFANGWSNYGGGYATAAFWKDESGIVTVEGMVAGGTLGTAAFVLPPGFCPALSRIYPAWSNNTLGLVQVTSAGAVQPLAVGTASNSSYSLDAIRFRTGKT